MRPPKNERQRHPRRRNFDDDHFYGGSPPMPIAAFDTISTGTEAGATVKWYNTEKGFGFVALADGSGDVFLHASVLQAAGYQTVSPGATLQVRVAQGQKGRQVQQVISVDMSTAESTDARPSYPQGRSVGPGPRARPMQRTPRPPVDLSTAVEMTGTVKWYNAAKGFGFITPENGGKDVFVHATALEQAGLPPLQEGQSVRMNVVQGAKGLEVGSISLA